MFARERRPSPCPASAHTQSGISRFSVYSLKKNFVHFIMAEQRIQQECNSRTSRQRLGAQSSQGRCRPRFSERKVGAFHFFYFFFCTCLCAPSSGYLRCSSWSLPRWTSFTELTGAMDSLPSQQCNPKGPRRPEPHAGKDFSLTAPWRCVKGPVNSDLGLDCPGKNPTMAPL